MAITTLLLISSAIALTSAIRVPYYPPVQSPAIQLGAAAAPSEYFPYRTPIYVPDAEEEETWQRPKRDHNDDYNRDGHNTGVTGPVHTFVKTDKNANYKWGVRHHVGPKYM